MKKHADFARSSISQARHAACQAEARASAAENAVLAAREDAFSQSPIKKEDEFLDDTFDPKGNTPFISVPGFPPANTLGTMRGSTTYVQANVAPATSNGNDPGGTPPSGDGRSGTGGGGGSGN